MALACPACTADAPIEVAWSLWNPARLDEWWNAKTRRVTPQGPLTPGQRIAAVTGPLGMFAVTCEVLEVDHSANRVRMLCRLPFGIVNDQTTSIVPLGPAQCRISFG
jgi:hypothetical protein